MDQETREPLGQVTRQNSVISGLESSDLDSDRRPQQDSNGVLFEAEPRAEVNEGTVVLDSTRWRIASSKRKRSPSVAGTFAGTDCSTAYRSVLPSVPRRSKYLTPRLPQLCDRLLFGYNAVCSLVRSTGSVPVKGGLSSQPFENLRRVSLPSRHAKISWHVCRGQPPPVSSYCHLHNHPC